VALRPSGIFGPRDMQMIPGFLDAAKAGKSKFQLGDNTKLFDFTYVGNVVDAHLLAADKLGVISAVGGQVSFKLLFLIE